MMGMEPPKNSEGKKNLRNGQSKVYSFHVVEVKLLCYKVYVWQIVMLTLSCEIQVQMGHIVFNFDLIVAGGNLVINL